MITMITKVSYNNRKNPPPVMGLFLDISMATMTMLPGTILIVKRRTGLNRQENSPLTSCVAQTSQV